MTTTKVDAEMRERARAIVDEFVSYVHHEEPAAQAVYESLMDAYRDGLEAAAKVIDKHAESAEAYPLRQMMVARAQEGRMLAECIRALIPQARKGGEG
jgi:hypothetical protein